MILAFHILLCVLGAGVIISFVVCVKTDNVRTGTPAVVCLMLSIAGLFVFAIVGGIHEDKLCTKERGDAVRVISYAEYKKPTGSEPALYYDVDSDRWFTIDKHQTFVDFSVTRDYKTDEQVNEMLTLALGEPVSVDTIVLTPTYDGRLVAMVKHNANGGPSDG